MNFMDDVRLSYKAKGIMTALLTLDTEEFAIHDICKLGKEKIDAVTSGLRELIEFGYITENSISENEGYIYIIGDRYGNYKIGKTSDMQQRLRQYRTAMPHEPIIVNVKKVENVHQFEKELHQKYKDKNINREWFRLEEKDVKELSSL